MIHSATHSEHLTKSGSEAGELAQERECGGGQERPGLQEGQLSGGSGGPSALVDRAVTGKRSRCVPMTPEDRTGIAGRKAGRLT